MQAVREVVEGERRDMLTWRYNYLQDWILRSEWGEYEHRASRVVVAVAVAAGRRLVGKVERGES